MKTVLNGYDKSLKESNQTIAPQVVELSEQKRNSVLQTRKLHKQGVWHTPLSIFTLLIGFMSRHMNTSWIGDTITD